MPDDIIYDIKKSENITEVEFKLKGTGTAIVFMLTNNDARVAFQRTASDPTYRYQRDYTIGGTFLDKIATAETFRLNANFAGSATDIVSNVPISLLIGPSEPEKELIATASSTVINGRSSTINIVFEDGKSFTPGETYTIYADYSQTDNYEQSSGVGELEIRKITTTSSLTGTNNITIGDTITLTLGVTDSSQNPVTRGTFNIYDGNTLIQSNIVITGQTTSVNITPDTVGVHNIYAVYTDTLGEYNNCTSNTFQLNVNKISTSLTAPNGLTLYFDETTTISGTLTNYAGALVNHSVMLYDGNALLQTVSTNNNGLYSFTYTPNSWSIDGNNLTVIYNGTNTQESATAIIPVNLMKRDVTVKSLTVEPAIANETNTIECELETSNNALINDGKLAFKADGVSLKGSDNKVIQPYVSNSKASTPYDIPSSWVGRTKTFTVTYGGSSNYNKLNDGGNVAVPIKSRSTITTTVDTISITLGDSETIQGTLTSNNTALSNQTIYLMDYDNTTPIGTTATNSNGEFTFTYTPANLNANNENIYVKYDGNSTYSDATKAITVSITQNTPISLEEFYNSLNWLNNAEAGYDSQVPEGSYVLLSSGDENDVPDDWYMGSSLDDLRRYILTFKIRTGDEDGYIFGFTDMTNNEDYLIIADPNGYIKLDATGVETNDRGQYQPLADNNEEISLSMYITPNSYNGVQIFINNGSSYTLTFNNDIDLSNTHLYFGSGDDLMIIRLDSFHNSTNF